MPSDHDSLTVPAPKSGGPRAQKSFYDRFCDLRNNLIAKSWFQKWSSSFPLTRGIAKRKAQDLFRITTGFVHTQILLACVELDLFEKLSDRPRTLSSLAQQSGMSETDMDRLLRGAVALDLLRRRSDDCYAIGELGAAFIGTPGLADMVRHNAAFYADLRDPVAVLRGSIVSGAVAALWSYAEADRPESLDHEQTAAYSDVMSSSQGMLAQDIIDAFPFDRHTQLLDVGGGNGAFLTAVAHAIPDLQLSLFDLPSVAEAARERVVQSGLEHRIAITGGDFLNDRLPGTPDVVSLIRIILDHPDEKVIRLLSAIRSVIAENGTLVIAEPVSGSIGAELLSDVYFPLYLKAMGRGNTRTFAQHEALLTASGFADVRRHSTRRPLMTSVLTARPKWYC